MPYQFRRQQDGSRRVGCAERTGSRYDIQLLVYDSLYLIGDIGTSYVLDDDSRPSQEGEFDSKLKYDRSGPVPIILVPQPSDDPNDPLVDSSIPTIHSVTEH